MMDVDTKQVALRALQHELSQVQDDLVYRSMSLERMSSWHYSARRHCEHDVSKLQKQMDLLCKAINVIQEAK